MYRSDGSRSFIFHAGNAATGQVDRNMIKPDVIQNAGWLHISGTAFTVGESCREAALYALDLAVKAGIPISFDPNVRVEMIGGQAKARELCEPALRAARVIVPTLAEARGLTGQESPDAVARAFLDMGIQEVVLKQGQRGCALYTKDGHLDVPGFPMTEVDPTGAGDIFAAGYVVGRLRGMSPVEAGRYANAAGALSVLKFGPMEGAPTDEDVQRLLKG
jgi:sugar/nucleoside kinase (ribokinase family)